MVKYPKISEPVGFGKSSLSGHRTIRNIRRDVTSVQRMLKDLKEDAGGSPSLAISGEIDGASDSTVAAIRRFQKKNFGWEDGVVDPMSRTESKLRSLTNADEPGPPVKPIPPVVGIAEVFLGPMGSRDRIVRDYYSQCGLETIGPGQIEVSSPKGVSTFEGLIDSLANSSSIHNVVVNHGDEAFGLLIPLCRETNFRNTGLIIGALAELADKAQNGRLNTSDHESQIFLKKVMKDASVSQSVVERIVGKLINLRKKATIVHFRACNFKHDFLARQYKRALGAQAVTVHGVRLLFVRIDPQQFKSGNTVDSEFAKHTSDATRRFRKFHDPLGEIASLLIGMLDKDGATNVESFSLIERRATGDVKGWAEALIRRWRDSASLQFVAPLMWSNDETTFHFPLETGWREKLRII